MSFGTVDYAPDRLIAGDFPLDTREVTLTDLGGTGALVRGTVLGVITASGLYGISLTAAVDGSQTPRAILVADADPSGGDVSASIYQAGQFDEGELTFGAAHDVDTVREPLRAVSIFTKIARAV